MAPEKIVKKSPAAGPPLRDLAWMLEACKYPAKKVANGVKVSTVTADSRQAGPGALFVAVRGVHVDGHEYASDAVRKGCVAVVVEKGRKAGSWGNEAVLVEVSDTRVALGFLAGAFFGNPAGQLKMIGITGTNGKTTTTYLLEALIKTLGGNPGVIGTVNYRYNDVCMPAPLTTPDPVTLHGLLYEMAAAGVTHVVMEVSSHALAQERLAGLFFDVGLFTNLSRDHLDFHGSMENYFASKKMLFTRHLKAGGVAILPASGEQAVIDASYPDEWRDVLEAELRSGQKNGQTGGSAPVITYGVKGGDIKPREFSQGFQGILARVVTPAGELHLRSSLVGEFNLRNLLGTIGVGMGLSVDLEKIKEGLEKDIHVPGRLEKVKAKKGVEVFVDYAHTPDALENVLQTLRQLKPGRLIVVFGCGGDRDYGKRPIMGEVAGRYADNVLITADNSRSETPEMILQAIESGLKKRLRLMRAEVFLDRAWRGYYDCIVSRREAIRVAIRYSRSGDVVVISGKGHENYQISRSGRIFFDDRLEAANYLAFVN